MLALITATKNSIRTIGDALASAAPFRKKIKHFLVDAHSSDGTRQYLEQFSGITENCVLLSQDGTGLYHALNQGIDAALADPQVTHIGFLHSDDRLLPQEFAAYLTQIGTSQSDFFYSDIQYHDKDERCVRVWETGTFSKLKLNTGWMPAHTSVIVTKRIYQDFGTYNPAFGTAADYEWIVRILSTGATDTNYFPKRTLSMLVGGASGASVAARLRANAMDGKTWAKKSLARRWLIRILKPMRKILQFRLIARKTPTFPKKT